MPEVPQQLEGESDKAWAARAHAALYPPTPPAAAPAAPPLKLLGHHHPFVLFGSTYRASRLSALDQWALWGGIETVVRSLGGRVDAASLAKALGALSDAEADGVLGALFEGVEREVDGAWLPALPADDGSGSEAPDLDAHEAVRVAVAAVIDRLGRYFAHKPAEIASKGAQAASWEAATLPRGLDYVMGPVLRGMCKFESLVDGSLDLAHVAMMNDALRCEAENRARAQAAAAKQ